MEPITTTEARAFMQIDADDLSEDSIIAGIISSEREAMELEIGLSLVKRKVTDHFRQGCCGIITAKVFRPKWAPIIGVASAKDAWGDCSPLQNEGTAEHPYFTLTYDTDVIYEAGFLIFPGDLKSALLERVASAYHNRENTTTEPATAVNKHAEKIVALRSRNVF
jgi:hypothetical protein